MHTISEITLTIRSFARSLLTEANKINTPSAKIYFSLLLVVLITPFVILLMEALYRRFSKSEKVFRVEYVSSMDTREKLLYTLLITIGILLFLRFLLWWFTRSHIAYNWYDTYNANFHIVDIILFILLSAISFFALLLEIGTWFTVWFMKRPKHIEPPEGMKVAFLTCFVPGKEPIEMLRETLVAMKECDYQHDTWVLDEGNQPEVQELCKELDVFHFSRSGIAQFNQPTGNLRAKTKAGNLNSWRHTYETDYDFIAQVDMDHIPHKDYLTKQLGYFKDDSIGYVGIPQYYKNTENWIARGSSQQTHFFYGPLQQGLYGSHMPFLTGTSHIYRAAAISEFDGYKATIAEDYITGMHFGSHGWKAIYVPEILAEGLGPENWTDYLNQQMRWSYGLFEILFKHLKHHIFKFPLRGGINILYSMLFYFTGIATYGGFILAALYLITGINSANIPLIQWFTYALPAYLWVVVIHIYLHRYYIEPKKEPVIGLSSILLWQAASVIYVQAFFDFLRRKKLTYKVTSKVKTSPFFTELGTFSGHAIIVALSALAIVVSFFEHHESIVMEALVIYNTLLLTAILLLAYSGNISSFIKQLYTNTEKKLQTGYEKIFFRKKDLYEGNIDEKVHI